eukprot:6104708-Lingulodinium_polyedra.AAC.1
MQRRGSGCSTRARSRRPGCPPSMALEALGDWHSAKAMGISSGERAVSYTHLRAHETRSNL